MRGVADQMVRNGIATLTGHIQIHKKGFRSDPVIDYRIPNPKPIEGALEKWLPADARWTARVRVNAVAANARHSSGVTLVGIDPEKEARISFIGHAVTRGRYLTQDDAYGIVVGQALVDAFETKLERKLVLMSQGTDREIASRAFRIVGIFRAELEATENQFVFVTKKAAQDMLKLDEAVSEISILLASNQEAKPVAASLQRGLAAYELDIDTWQELLPMITAIMRMHDTFIYLWYLVVFIAMGFGIVNTTLMAIFERIREFGLLKALGMKPAGVIKGVMVESIFLLILGMAIGNAIGLSTVFLLSHVGIDLSALAQGMEFVGMSRVIFPTVAAKDILSANLVVFFLGLLVSIYPALKAARFKPVKALAHT